MQFNYKKLHIYTLKQSPSPPANADSLCAKCITWKLSVLTKPVLDSVTVYL